MGPECPLPLPHGFKDADDFVDSLLHFITSSRTFLTLCGGVHILDFMIRQPDPYAGILPQDWRDWCEPRSIQDFMDICMSEDLNQFSGSSPTRTWRNGPPPPPSMIDYIQEIRKHTLDQKCQLSQNEQRKSGDHDMTLRLNVGMKTKKVHEVTQFAQYVDQLTGHLEEARGESISHIVDFGSGKNYLGRTLACPPYNKHIIAVERKQGNVDGARLLDVHAKLAVKKKVPRNKKVLRGQILESEAQPVPPEACKQKFDPGFLSTESDVSKRATLEMSKKGEGSIQYVMHSLEDGNLSNVVEQIVDTSNLTVSSGQDQMTGENENQDTKLVTVTNPASTDKSNFHPGLLVLSIHSCGNLSHHGIRSISLNPSVAAVAMVGCCYNLMTERLGPPTYKLPSLRSNHPRLDDCASACDPHGFPMSSRLANYTYTPLEVDESKEKERGIRMNITARMMAVQAPYNWTEKDTSYFFTRHFYRSMLQRLLLDIGLLDPDSPSLINYSDGKNGRAPMVLGSLPKASFDSFIAYVRAATKKLESDPDPGRAAFFGNALRQLTDEQLIEHEKKFAHKKKHLSIAWTLMAFSAAVVESAIVVDRWQWLRELDCVGDGRCWVERIFDYSISPRSFVVVGVRKR